MNSKKALIISLSVLLALIGLLIFIMYLPMQEETKTMYYENEEIPTTVTIKNEEGSFTVSKNDDTWMVSGLENIPLNESFCYSLFNAAKSLSADNIFEPKTNLNEYGLENPKIIVNSNFDKKQTLLKIGNKNASNTAYYCLKDDSNQIGLIPISAITPFLRENSKYASLTLIPYSMRTTDDEGNWVSGGITECTITRQNLNESIDLIADSNGNLNIVNPQDITLNSDIQNQLENAPFSLIAEELYKVNPNNTIITSCGLNLPIADIKYVINGETYEFKIGSVSNSTQYSHTIDNSNSSENTVNKSYYVMIENTPAIYTVNQSNLPWLNMTFAN